MKKNQNIKIRPNYKTLAMILLFGFAGCKRYEHKNIFLDMVRDGTKRTILIRDVETGTERIFNADEYWDGRHVNTWHRNYDYLQPGDTVTVVVGRIYSDTTYKNYKVLSSDELTLLYNKDSVHNRKEREKFNQMKQQMQNGKQK